MNEYLLWQLLTVVLIVYGTYRSIKGTIEHNRRIAEGVRAIGRRGRQKRKTYIFVEENESKMKRCQYCSKPISKEEYENERYGYCDECSDDLATEEEEEVWGM